MHTHIQRYKANTALHLQYLLPHCVFKDQEAVFSLLCFINLSHLCAGLSPLQSESPVTQKGQSKWKKIKVLTDKRRKAIVSCFMAVPFFKLPL